MPGPQDPSDQAAGAYGRGYDPPRRPDLREESAERPARGSLTEMRQRLERLPPGHPSSPYHDDGSRKPPVVRLKDLELPLPGEAGTGETETHQAHADEAHADEAHADEAHADEAHADGSYADDARVSSSYPDDAQADDAQTGDAQASDAQADDAQADDAQRGEPEPERLETGWPDAAENAPGALEGTGSRAASDPPRIWADGSWEWKGQRLKSGECKTAEEMLGRCRAAEGRTVFGTYGDTGLTPAMRRVEAQLEHGHLVPETEKFALKSADRFKEKLAKLIARSPGAEPAELASSVHDSIRYTFLFEPSHYTRGVTDACQRLADEGYQLVESRPSWDKDEYKGVNSQWRDLATGLSFEVQWHTPESWDAKQKTHAAYEKINDRTTPIAEVERLRAYQREVSAMVAVPPGALQIRPHKKES
jgi:hypothetical protein